MPLCLSFQSLIRLLRVPSAAEKASWMASLKERASGSFRKKHGERVGSSYSVSSPDVCGSVCYTVNWLYEESV